MSNVIVASSATLAFALVACDSGTTASAPSSPCAEAGPLCQLPDGPLGVCERATCRAGEEPPCFQCTPQH